MISLKVDSNYEIDLKEDFMFNEDKSLYDFIDGDLVKAFYLGLHAEEWFKELKDERQLLYSKPLRHNGDDLEKYQSQITYWSNKFSGNDEDIVSYAELTEFILNNMILEDEDDLVKLALFFGGAIYKRQILDEEDEDIH